MCKSRKIISLLGIMTVVTVLIVIFLVYHHKSTEIEIELAAERIDFAMVNPLGIDRRIPLVSFLSVSSLALSNFEPVELRVDKLYDINDISRPLLTKKKVVIVPADQKFSRLTLKGENLSLMDLDVQPNVKITLAISEDGMIDLRVHPDSVNSNAFPIVQGIVSIIDRVEALVERCEVTDENGKPLFVHSPQRRFLIDLGSLGGNLVYRSNHAISLSMNLTSDSRVGNQKSLGIYDPDNDSWTVVPPPLPLSLPNAVAVVVDGKIYVMGGTSTLQRSSEIRLLNSNLNIACLKFLKPSLGDPSKEMTTIKEGNIIFPNGESDEIRLRSEFVQLKEEDCFNLVNTEVENSQLRLFLAGRPKSVLVGFQQETMNQKLPTLFKWLRANQTVAVIIILLYFVSYVISLMVGIRTLASNSRKGKDKNEQS